MSWGAVDRHESVLSDSLSLVSCSHLHPRTPNQQVLRTPLPLHRSQLLRPLQVMQPRRLMPQPQCRPGQVVVAQVDLQVDVHHAAGQVAPLLFGRAWLSSRVASAENPASPTAHREAETAKAHRG